MKKINKLAYNLTKIELSLKTICFVSSLLILLITSNSYAVNYKNGKTIIEQLWSSAYTDPKYAIEFCSNALKDAENNKDTVLCAEFNRIIGSAYHNLSQYNLAIEHYAKSYNYYYKKNNIQKIADVYNDIGTSYLLLNNYTESQNYFFNALKLFTKINRKNDISIIFSNIGSCYFNRFDYVNAVSYYLKGLKIADKLHDKDALAMLLNNLAIIYKNLRNYEQALVYYKKAFQIYQELNDISSLALVENNIGNIYFLQNKIDEALKYYNKSLEFKKKINNKPGIATSLNNIGEIYETKENFSKALEHYFLSLNLMQEMQNSNGIVYTTECVARIYFKQQDYKKAEVFFQRAIELGKINKIPTQTSHNYLSEIYRINNDYEKSLFHLQEVAKVQDSVFGSEKVQQINELLANYETDKRDEEISSLTETNKVQERQIRERTIFLIILGSLFGLLVIFVILTIRNSKRINLAKNDLNEVNRIQQETNAKLEDALQELRHEIGIRQKVEQELLHAQEKLAESLEKAKELNELKTRFISMVTHEYRNPLTVIMNITEFLPRISRQKNPENYEKHIQMIRDEVNRMVKLLNDVLVIGKKGSAQHQLNIMTMPLSVICNDLVTNAKFVDEEKHNFILNISSNVDLITTDTQYLSFALSNLVINAAKYSPWGTNIYIDITGKGDKIKIKIRDEGIGIPDDDKPLIFEPFHRGSNIGSISGNGLGLSIVKMYLDLLEGTIDFESQENNGTTFEVTLPKVHN